MKPRWFAHWLLSLLLLPIGVFAQPYDGPGVQTGIATAQPAGLQGQTIQGVAIGVLNTILGTLGAVAVLMIVVAGIMMLTQSGDDSKRQQALKMILYIIIGLVIAALAGVIVRSFISAIY